MSKQYTVINYVMHQNGAEETKFEKTYEFDFLSLLTLK